MNLATSKALLLHHQPRGLLPGQNMCTEVRKYKVLNTYPSAGGSRRGLLARNPHDRHRHVKSGENVDSAGWRSRHLSFFEEIPCLIRRIMKLFYALLTLCTSPLSVNLHWAPSCSVPTAVREPPALNVPAAFKEQHSDILHYFAHSASFHWLYGR
jgi:hypothetical protein